MGKRRLLDREGPGPKPPSRLLGASAPVPSWGSQSCALCSLPPIPHGFSDPTRVITDVRSQPGGPAFALPQLLEAKEDCGPRRFYKSSFQVLSPQTWHRGSLQLRPRARKTSSRRPQGWLRATFLPQLYLCSEEGSGQVPRQGALGLVLQSGSPPSPDTSEPQFPHLRAVIVPTSRDFCCSGLSEVLSTCRACGKSEINAVRFTVTVLTISCANEGAGA